MDKNYKFDIDALPLSWYYYSERLQESAEIIILKSPWEVNRFPYLTNGKALSEPFFLDYGFAIENAIKGYLISEDKELTKNYEIDKKITANHDLVNLIKYVDKKKIELSKEDKCLLKRLSECIKYWGRYPTAKKANNNNCVLEYSEGVHKNIKSIWLTFFERLYNNVKDGWENANGLNSGTFRDSFWGELSINNIPIKPGNIQL